MRGVRARLLAGTALPRVLWSLRWLEVVTRRGVFFRPEDGRHFRLLAPRTSR